VHRVEHRAFGKRLLAGTIGSALLSMAAGCSDGLGKCNKPAADELVYSEDGLIATKGQALVHDTCGSAVFCHSAAAKGSARSGAPHGMNFDMLPSPLGLKQILMHRESAWDAVESGEMPPRNYKGTLDSAKWSFDLQRRPDAPTLPSLSSAEGKAILQNWLACGAPVVTETRAPAWAQPARNPFPPDQAVAWKDLYEMVLAPSCAQAGCHDATTAAGKLTFKDVCQARKAVLGSGLCGKILVEPGDPDASFLVEKLESATPSCGSSMPPTGRLAQPTLDAIRSWISDGASAADVCN
jgi:hypothetical protein